MKSAMAAMVLVLSLAVGQAWAGTTGGTKEVTLVERQETFASDARVLESHEGPIAIEDNLKRCLFTRAEATRYVVQGLVRSSVAYSTYVSGLSSVVSATRANGDRVVFTLTCVAN